LIEVYGATDRPEKVAEYQAMLTDLSEDN